MVYGLAHSTNANVDIALARKGTSTIHRQEERNETVELDEEEEGGGHRTTT